MKHYPETATERFDDANFHINYCLSFIKKYIKGNILEIGAGCGSFTKNDYKSKFKNIVQLSNKYKIPVLFSKSTYPYKTIGILVNNDFESNSPNTISFDLSNSMSCSVLAVNVSKPKFLQNEDQSILKSTLEKLQNLALAQNTNFLIEQTEGNEAKVFSELSTKFELSVLGISTNNWQERKILDYVTKSSNSSVLYIPK